MINCAPYYVPIGPDGNYTGLMKNGKVINEGRVADIYGGVSKGNVGKDVSEIHSLLKLLPSRIYP